MIAALSLLLLLGQAGDTTAVSWRVDGRIERGLRTGPQPLAGQWVVLHRVGHDRSGPLDSVRTGTDGQYHFRYHRSGDTSAIYFATTAFGGIVYPSSPFRAPLVKGDDALITVFDTTSGPVAIQVGGRHLVIGAPNADGRRPVGEVYDLENDSTVTAIARDGTAPVWTAHIPAEAVAFQVNPNGDLAAGAMVRQGTSVGLLAPVSPGIRQLAFTYELPPRAFPLSVPIERGTGVFEVLVQEPTARLSGPALREVPAEAAEGRVFRRFLAQDVPGDAVLTIDLPRLIGPGRKTVYLAVGLSLLAAMVASLVLAVRRRPRAATAPSPGPGVAGAAGGWHDLVQELASLDEAFERAGSGDADRAAYETERARLKAALARALSAERHAAGGAPLLRESSPR